MPTITGPLVPVTKIVKSALVDPSGDRLGRVDDIIVRLADRGYPPVTGLTARVGGRRLFVPAELVAELVPGRVALSGKTLNLGRFERRPGEVLLRQDVLDRKLIDVANGKLVHANDIELGCIDGWWRIVGVDPSSRGILKRLLPSAVDKRVGQGAIVDWSDVEPFVGHVPTAKLLLPLRRLKRLHPAQIADLVERASHDEGGEIITAVGDDPELEADVFEELDTHHQLEFLGEKSDQEAAEILGEMAPDDAADLINEIDQDRRAHVLELLPAEHQRKVRALLAYNPTTAGGMMSPDFVRVDDGATVGDALEVVRRTDRDDFPARLASVVVIVDSESKLVGTVNVPDLLRRPEQARVVEALEPVTARLADDADVPDVALLMSDYNLIGAPVVDDDDRVLGVVTVDDVLEELIPDDWRRRHSADGG